MNDERVIRELIEGWAAAVRRQDLDSILAHHAANIVMFDVPAPVVLRGLDAYRESWGPFLKRSAEAARSRSPTSRSPRRIAWPSRPRCCVARLGRTTRHRQNRNSA
jgi:hypothetical protein